LLATSGLAQRVERVVREGGTAYVLHEEASTPLAGGDLPAAGDVLVIVGPEGGIAPGEVESLTRAGALPVRLGSTVLRSSSAGPAALAVLNAQARWR
jgi:16S rRNA (uracil1498-N3)-methyltransferase